ncbi:TPA: VENN motif pre-toxin domain-containing protein [Yersinia enterocolitica]|nr:VENN motif pre-toxin domain-containing protein [Yersinia enterocolitica]HEI6958701.1 VENN motif pre-toxin domain-containing protein [Yersinia enterocolitica]
MFAGKGGFDITVGEHTQLDGAVIASTATADKNTLDTGTLGFSNIGNKADFKVEHQSVGISTGGNIGGQFVGNMANGLLVGANNEGHADSTTHAAISDGTITIRDTDKQQQNVTDLSRDVEHANNALSPIFDKEKEQNRLREINLIGDIGNQVADIARTQGKIAEEKALKDPKAIQAAKDALAENGNLTPTNKQLVEQIRNTASASYGTGSDLQRAIQAATAITQGLTGGNLGQALAGGSAPYLAHEISKYLPADQSLGANLMAHAVLGAVVGHFSGNAAVGAVSAFTAEAAAPAIIKAMGWDKDSLTEKQKQTVSALATLAAGLAGGLVGDSSSSAVAGAQAGKNAVENNALSSLGDIFGSQGAKYFEGAGSLEKELLQNSNLTDQEKKTIRDQYIKGDLPEDVLKAILENNPGSDTVMALLNAKNPEDYALALLSTLPAERALALIGKMTKGAQATGVFNIADRVYAQLNDSRLGSLSGKLNVAELQKLANNPAAVRVYDARSGHINVIQSVDGKLLRITVPNNEMKIISVGPIRPNQVKNLIEKGSFVPLP